MTNRKRRLARLIWSTLAAFVLGGSLLAIVLAFGAADPPRAGPLYAEIAPPAPQKIVSGSVVTVGEAIALPPPPYTLEIAAELAPESDRLAWWGVSFGDGKLAITLSVDAYFTMPPVVPDSHSFFHIQPPGKVNRLYLNVDFFGRATLRFNGEIAWEGQLPMLLETPRAVITGSGPHHETLVIVHHIALFAPQN